MPKTKTKKKHDPNRPKRPLTAFMRYSASRRSVIRTENNDLSMIQISKIIGEEWRGLGDDGKRPFHDQAAADHEKYKTAKEAYDASKPKRPRTAYAFFMKENRAAIAAKNPGTTPRDLMKFIAADWKKLTDNGKAKYSKMASDDRERWDRDRAASL
jgi:hypothetical protein